MAQPSTQILTTVKLDEEQLKILTTIGAALYSAGTGAMINRAIEEFIERELARPDFKERAAKADKERGEFIDRLLNDRHHL